MMSTPLPWETGNGGSRDAFGGVPAMLQSIHVLAHCRERPGATRAECRGERPGNQIPGQHEPANKVAVVADMALPRCGRTHGRILSLVRASANDVHGFPCARSELRRCHHTRPHRRHLSRIASPQLGGLICAHPETWRDVLAARLETIANHFRLICLDFRPCIVPNTSHLCDARWFRLPVRADVCASGPTRVHPGRDPQPQRARLLATPNTRCAMAPGLLPSGTYLYSGSPEL